MTELLQWDEYFFHLINSGSQNPFFDIILPVVRNKYTWFPFYVFLLSFLTINFKKRGWYVVLALALTVGITDATTSHVLKKSVRRLRPCKVIENPVSMNLLVPCGSGYSFPSSHASNHFGMAVFLSLSLGSLYKWVRIPLLLWALLICYAQVYVGVHYPLDVLVGGLWGSLAATLVYLVFRQHVRILNPGSGDLQEI